MTPGNKLALMMAVCLSLIPVSVYAQGSTASLAGTVRDEQGLIVPGAAVTLAATENTFSRTVTTDPSGAFEFAGLLPGEYKMRIELAGFAPKAVNVSMAVNQRIRLDVVL